MAQIVRTASLRRFGRHVNIGLSTRVLRINLWPLSLSLSPLPLSRSFSHSLDAGAFDHCSSMTNTLHTHREHSFMASHFHQFPLLRSSSDIVFSFLPLLLLLPSYDKTHFFFFLSNVLLEWHKKDYFKS